MNKNQLNAEIALKHRLYSSPNWMLIDELRDAKNGDRKITVSLKYVDDVPVGVVTRDHETGLVMVFVRKSFRKKGIGSQLVKRVARAKNSWGCKDSPSRGKIFSSNGIDARWYGW